jgi:hypothetical protein
LRAVASIGEIGSGLNGHRPKLMKLLADPSIKTIVVEHRVRLMRFGVEYVECSLQAQGRRLIIVDQGEVKDDLVQDMIEVLTITKKRRNLNNCRCLATGPSLRSGQFFSRTPQKQIVGASLRMLANAVRSPASGLL